MGECLLARRGGAGAKNKIVRCGYATVQPSTRIDLSQVAVFFAPTNPTCVVFPQEKIYLYARENVGTSASQNGLFHGTTLSYGTKGAAVQYLEENGTPYVIGINDSVSLVFGYTK